MTVYEELFEQAVANSESAADVPKALGDVCTNPKCKQITLVYEPDFCNREDPGFDAVIYCPACGSDYAIDWNRMPNAKLADATTT